LSSYYADVYFSRLPNPITNEEDAIMAGKEQHSEKLSKKLPKMTMMEKRAAKRAKKMGAPIGQSQPGTMQGGMQ
jgi:hypothetical protein